MNSKSEKRERRIGYFFILPAVIYMLIFIGYPIVYNWIISLQDVTATTLASAARDFVGLDNFKAIFSDVTFRKSVLHTFVYTIGCLVIQYPHMLENTTPPTLDTTEMINVFFKELAKFSRLQACA